MRCIQIHTPHSIEEEKGDGYWNEVFSDLSMVDHVGRWLNTYYDRMIGDCDPERWVLKVRRRADTIDRIYNMKLALMTKENIDSQVGRKRTQTDTVDTTLTDSTISTQEDIPETADASVDPFLTGRDKSDRNATGKDNRSVTEEITEGLPLEIAERQLKAYRDVVGEWISEFEDLFLRMW